MKTLWWRQVKVDSKLCCVTHQFAHFLISEAFARLRWCSTWWYGDDNKWQWDWLVRVSVKARYYAYDLLFPRRIKNYTSPEVNCTPILLRQSIPRVCDRPLQPIFSFKQLYLLFKSFWYHLMVQWVYKCLYEQ